MATQRFYDGQPGPDIRRELNNFEAILDGTVAAAQDASTAATDSKNAAATSATAAKTSETNAASSASAAAASQTAAATSESAALASKNAAATSATAAKTSETNAASSASAAATSANAAAASAGGQLWVSGATYAVGALVFSALTGRNYRRVVAGAGTTDPSLDSTNWRATLLDVDTGMPAIRPSLLLDFANSKTVDPRITFTRASTATYFDAQGLMRTAASGVPRIDHDPVTGACKGLLIEEARTNRCLSSADVGFSNWGNSPNIQVLGRAIAPDGTNTATVFGYLATTGGAFSATFLPVAAGETVTASVYLRLKAGTLQPGIGASIIVDDANDVRKALYVGAEDTPVLDGTYRRHSITVTNSNTAGTLRFYVAVDFAPGVEIEVWGAQLEGGHFPTSYIPTTAAGVTRAAEIAYISQDKLSAFTKLNSGTVSAEYSIQGFSKTTVQVYSVVVMGFEGGNYSVELRSYSNAAGNYDSDAIIQYPGYPFDSDGSNRAVAGIKVSSAISYGAKGATASAFGEFKGTNATPFTPAQHSVISLGNSFNTSFLNGHIRRVAYFPAELPITELNALTAL